MTRSNLALMIFELPPNFFKIIKFSGAPKVITFGQYVCPGAHLFVQKLSGAVEGRGLYNKPCRPIICLHEIRRLDKDIIY